MSEEDGDKVSLTTSIPNLDDLLASSVLDDFDMSMSMSVDMSTTAADDLSWPTTTTTTTDNATTVEPTPGASSILSSFFDEPEVASNGAQSPSSQPQPQPQPQPLLLPQQQQPASLLQPSTATPSGPLLDLTPEADGLPADPLEGLPQAIRSAADEAAYRDRAAALWKAARQSDAAALYAKLSALQGPTPPASPTPSQVTTEESVPGPPKKPSTPAPQSAPSPAALETASPSSTQSSIASAFGSVFGLVKSSSSKLTQKLRSEVSEMAQLVKGEVVGDKDTSEPSGGIFSGLRLRSKDKQEAPDASDDAQQQQAAPSSKRQQQQAQPPALRIIVVRRWCSWCFRIADHEQQTDNWVSRNLHSCRSCLNESIPCVACPEMARSFGSEGSDRMCFKCTGAYREANRDLGALDVGGYCSWCTKPTMHRLVRAAWMNRNLYQCLGCRQRTLRCRNCPMFARSHVGSWNDELCSVCDGMYENWDQAQKTRIGRKAWCSWCVSESEHFLHQRNIVRKDIYMCSQCDQKTTECTQCERSMTQVGRVWPSSTCLACELHAQAPVSHVQEDLSITWVRLQSKRDAVFNTSHSLQRVRDQMRMASGFKEQAYFAGLLRPFLLLVSMHPGMRSVVAHTLGMSLIQQPFFGDAHAESWAILHTPVHGIVARASGALAKLSLSARKPTWLEVLRHVVSVVFKAEPIVKHGGADVLAECRQPTSELVLGVEKEFLFHVGRKHDLLVRKKERELSELRERDRLSRQRLQKEGDDGETTPASGDLLSLDGAAGSSPTNDTDAPSVMSPEHDATEAEPAPPCAEAVAAADAMQPEQQEREQSWRSSLLMHANITEIRMLAYAVAMLHRLHGLVHDCPALVTATRRHVRVIAPLAVNSAGEDPWAEGTLFALDPKPSILFVSVLLLMDQRILLAVEGIQVDDYSHIE